MNWIKKIFAPFRLPKEGDKVIGKGDGRYVYEVRQAMGDRNCNVVLLMCGTYFETGEWEIVDKKTPTRY